MNMILFFLLSCQDKTPENKVEKTVEKSATVETKTNAKTEVQVKKEVDAKTKKEMTTNSVNITKLDPKNDPWL